MATRKHTLKKYQRMATQLHDCLNSNKFKLKDVINVNNRSFFCVRPTNSTAYIEYDGHLVLDHILIIPYDDSVTEYAHMNYLKFADLHTLIVELQEEFGKKYILVWKGDQARSIKKWHAHFIVI